MFGDMKNPIRCSSLPTLIQCPAKSVLSIGLDRTSNKAADTGSAVHKGADAWHRKGGLDAAIATMRDHFPDYPLADLEEAEILLRCYAKDSRNAPEKVKTSELALSFSLPPHPSDETRQLIYFTGTCDQVREEPDAYYIWDIKTGKPEGWGMLQTHAIQLAGYREGVAQQFTDKPVKVGGIIRVRGYTTRGVIDPEPAKVFWHSGMGEADCRVLLNRVQHIVAGVRRGELHYGPGEHCMWCPFGSTDRCIPMGRELASH